MTLNPLKSPVLFSALFAWLVALIASVLPIWQVSFVIGMDDPNDPWLRVTTVTFPWKSTEPGTLRKFVKWRPYAFGSKSSFPGLLQEDVHNLALGFAILACGAGVGRLFYWLLRERGQPITSGLDTDRGSNEQ
jgi:hypothetical protein